MLAVESLLFMEGQEQVPVILAPEDEHQLVVPVAAVGEMPREEPVARQNAENQANDEPRVVQDAPQLPIHEVKVLLLKFVSIT